MKRKLIAAIGVAGMMVGLAACGSDDGGEKNAGADGFKGETLTVWAMDGSTPDQWQKDLTADFEKKTGAKVKFEVQQWNGIQQKLTTALSEENPPDVFEIGNTQTAAYAKTGGLADLGGPQERDRHGLGREPQQGLGRGREAVRRPVVLRQSRRRLQQEGLRAEAGIKPRRRRPVTSSSPRSTRSRPRDQGRADLPARPELVLLRRAHHRQGCRPGEEGRRQVGLQPRRPEDRQGHRALQEVPELLQGPQGQGRGHPAAGRGLRQGQGRCLHRHGLGGRHRHQGQPGDREGHRLLHHPR